MPARVSSLHMSGGKLQTILDYHERSKHRLARYAAGPETLDWDMQPDPFRRFAGSLVETLPLLADSLAPGWAELFQADRIAPRGFDRDSVAMLLELSFGLSAWKQYGPDRWALRCNPSSGNLHPTEVYVLASGMNAGATALHDGLYHYAPREHELELRATPGAASPHADPHLWVALSSVHWREAWKYGERAFRYCQLDAGHAIGALRYAAAVLGWQARVMRIDGAALAELIGVDRETDFRDAEREEPEMLIGIFPPGVAPLSPPHWTAQTVWSGRASRLDKGRRFYRWPVIEEVAQASRASVSGGAAAQPDAPPLPAVRPTLARVHTPASELIRQRRSAQHFERRASMPAADFIAIARSLMGNALPWDAWPYPTRIHPVFFVHRVDGLASGAWAMPRSARGEHLMRSALAPEMPWQGLTTSGDAAADDLPLYLLADNPALAATLRTLCCHQAIGSDACFAVAMLADFSASVQEDPANYRLLFQEAGLLGQVLYLEAEAHGLRGTGIGCYFDDGLHDLLGMRDRQLQSLYHFTVGVPISDSRISTEPPYAARHATTPLPEAPP